jgi:cathepsin L
MGVNRFTDMFENELKQRFGYDKIRAFAERSRAVVRGIANDYEIMENCPQSVDWRTEGILTPVKDQGHCGSCWTFASTEAIEAHLAISTGVLVELSEQNLVECVQNPNQCGGSGGCKGATAELAFDYVQKNGIASEWNYPYSSGVAGISGNCSKTYTPFAKIGGFQALGTNNLADLMKAIVIGPVAVSVDASAWSKYETGVFNGCNQSNPDINHLVLLVGYDDQAWIIRNSWGPTWGDHGYIRIQRDFPGQVNCGVDLSPLDGSGCKGGPANVTTCGTCGILYDNAYPLKVALY